MAHRIMKHDKNPHPHPNATAAQLAAEAIRDGADLDIAIDGELYRIRDGAVVERVPDADRFDRLAGVAGTGEHYRDACRLLHIDPDEADEADPPVAAAAEPSLDDFDRLLAAADVGVGVGVGVGKPKPKPKPPPPEASAADDGEWDHLVLNMIG